MELIEVTLFNEYKSSDTDSSYILILYRWIYCNMVLKSITRQVHNVEEHRILTERTV